MSEIVTLLLPFFGLIACGYGAQKYLAIPRQGAAGLQVFLHYFALPGLFFQLVAETPWASLPSVSFLLTTSFAAYCAFAIAFSFSALVNRGNVPEATISGLIGSNANIANLAPGLTLAAFGSAAAAPTALIFTLDSAMLAILVPLMMALGAIDRTRLGDMGRTMVRDVAYQPIIIATMLGLVVSFTGLGLPAPVGALFGFLRSAAPPTALFAIGLMLAHGTTERPPLDLPVLLLVKLIVHPLIVYLLLGWVGGYDRVWVLTAVLCAALPPAANLFATARRYQGNMARVTAAVVFGTIASVVTITLTVTLLFSGVLAIDPFY